MKIKKIIKEQKKIFIIAGIVILMLIFVLYTIHVYAGFFLVYLYNEYDFADSLCQSIAKKGPMWLLGTGFVKSSIKFCNTDSKGCTDQGLQWLVRREKESLPYLHIYLDDGREPSILAWINVYRVLWGIIGFNDVQNKNVVDRLLIFTESSSHMIKASSIGLLGEIGKPKDIIIPKLMSIIKNTDIYDLDIVFAIGDLPTIEGYEENIFNILLSLLSSSDEKMRREAQFALGEQANKNNEMLMLLLNTCEDTQKDIIVRTHCVRALKNVDHTPVSVSKTLVRMLQEKSDKIRAVAASVIEFHGRRVKDAIPFLIDFLDNKNKRIRINSIGALGTMGRYAKDVIPALKEIKENDPDADIRKVAETAINRIKEDFEPGFSK